MTKRLSIALASTALAGGALLGAGGPASAPVQHTSYVSLQQTTDHQEAPATLHGVTAARRHQNQIDEATSSYRVSAARRHQDQAEEAVLPHGVSAARRHQDQVAWSLTHS
ncbi:hypothetical protein ABT275_42810 [Streptomyces sp. NPDC001185]|uniref:hypothetical protein n=1 Tax=Streptomyces sp. NPDC001185 TaxID=3154380 RepID=UPI00333046DA